METIHLKSVDPTSQALLKSAARRGIELSWERLERLQPQDGFQRLGLSCPYGCMQGPCRIDPFDRGAGKGSCGLDRETMVAATLLRLTLQGLLESMERLAAADDFPRVSFSAPLLHLLEQRRETIGQTLPGAGDLLKAAAMLCRPSASSEQLLSQTLRLSLLAIACLDQEAAQEATETTAAGGECRVGYGAAEGRPVRIGLCGRLSADLLSALRQATTGESALPVALVSLGDWLHAGDGFVPIISTSGEAELPLSAGLIHLLVAGQGTDPGLLALCRQMGIPVFPADTDCDPGLLLDQARKVYGASSQLEPLPDPPPLATGVVPSAEGGGAMPPTGAGEKIAFVGGADTPQATMGSLPVELAARLRDHGWQVASWGDAALWMVKDGLCLPEQTAPVTLLADRVGPWQGVKQLLAAGQGDRLQGICFTGLKGNSDLAVALGLACLGCRVNVATPLPLGGSRPFQERLAATLALLGGQFVQQTEPVQAKKMAEWFLGA